jgi:hypothetical protein
LRCVAQKNYLNINNYRQYYIYTVKLDLSSNLRAVSRKVLTLSERVEAIKLHDSGKSSRDVAQIMGVGRTQIQQIIKRKSEVLDAPQNSVFSCYHFYIYVINVLSVETALKTFVVVLNTVSRRNNEVLDDYESNVSNDRKRRNSFNSGIYLKNCEP